MKIISALVIAVLLSACGGVKCPVCGSKPSYSQAAQDQGGTTFFVCGKPDRDGRILHSGNHSWFQKL